MLPLRAFGRWLRDSTILSLPQLLEPRHWEQADGPFPGGTSHIAGNRYALCQRESDSWQGYSYFRAMIKPLDELDIREQLLCTSSSHGRVCRCEAMTSWHQAAPSL